MNYPALGVASLVLLIAIVGCGFGGGGFNANNVTVTVSPATAAIPANGQVTLQATVHGLCSTCASSIQVWGVTEDPSAGANCFYFQPPPLGPCPAGAIQETAGGLGSSLTVTYFAPSTPGTYHVTAEWFLLTGPTKVGTSAITVGP
jgi:hypothetical protein